MPMAALAKTKPRPQIALNCWENASRAARSRSIHKPTHTSYIHRTKRPFRTESIPKLANKAIYHNEGPPTHPKSLQTTLVPTFYKQVQSCFERLCPSVFDELNICSGLRDHAESRKPWAVFSRPSFVMPVYYIVLKKYYTK